MKSIIDLELNTCKPATELLAENKEIVPVIAFNFDASSKTKNTL